MECVSVCCSGAEYHSRPMVCNCVRRLTRTQLICHCERSVAISSNLSLRAQRGNLVAVAMVAVAIMVRRRVLNLNEIATSRRSSQ